MWRSRKAHSFSCRGSASKCALMRTDDASSPRAQSPHPDGYDTPDWDNWSVALGSDVLDYLPEADPSDQRFASEPFQIREMGLHRGSTNLN